MSNSLIIQNISKSFGNHSVIKNFSYQFEPGNFYVITGESGSGKSTLLNIMSLIDLPDAGNILWHDQNILKSSGSQKRKLLRFSIGYLFQNYALVDQESILKNLEIGMHFNTPVNKKEAIDKAMQSVGLKMELDRKVFTLSGGEQQRVALARLSLKQFDILYADEPTGNLDNENTGLVINLLHQFKQDKKIVIVATHDQSIINAADIVIHLESHETKLR